MKRFYFSVVFFLFIGLVLTAVITSSEAMDGRAVFETQLCNHCHSVSIFGIPGKNNTGGDLTNVGSRRSREEIIVFLRGYGSGSRHAKPFKGTDEELQAVVDFILKGSSGSGRMPGSDEDGIGSDKDYFGSDKDYFGSD